jgi:hypothetical protein
MQTIKGTAASVWVNNQQFAKNGIVVTYFDEEQGVYFAPVGTTGQPYAIKYSQIENGDTGEPFASYQELKDYIEASFFEEPTSGGGGEVGEGIPQDNVPIAGSSNNVKSGGVFSALQLKAAVSYVDNQVAAVSTEVDNLGLQLIDGAPADYNTFNKIKGKLTALEGFVNGNDINLDTIRELADAIKADEGLVATINANKLNIADVYNALDYALEGKALDARQGKLLGDAITAINNSLANKADASALAGKADLINNKVNPAQLNQVYFDLPGTGEQLTPFRQSDQVLRAMRFLGSPLRGQSVGLSPMLTFGSGNSLASQNYYGVMIEVPEGALLTGVSYMLATLGVYTAANENSAALFTYNAGILTQVAKTASKDDFYSKANPGVVSYQEPFITPYQAGAGFYFLVFLFNATGTVTTAPNLINFTFGSAGEKAGIKTTNGGKITFKSQVGNKVAMPSSITLANENAYAGLTWGGVY